MFLQLFIILLLWSCFRYRNRHKRILANSFNTNLRTWPLIGLAHHFIGTEQARMKKMIKVGQDVVKQGGVTGGWVFNDVVVSKVIIQGGNRGIRLYGKTLPAFPLKVIADPFDAEVAMRESRQKIHGLPVTKGLIVNGHIFAKVPIWRPRRKIMTSVFCQKNLNKFLTVFHRQSEVLVDQLESVAGKGTFTFWKYVVSYSMDAIIESTLGINLNVQNNPDHHFFSNFNEITKVLNTYLQFPWYYIDNLYKFSPGYENYKKNQRTLKKFVRQVIMAKRLKFKETENEEKAECDQLQNQLGNSKSFLELLIHASGGELDYTDVELQEELLGLMFDGRDTTAIGAAFTAIALSQHQEIQNKLYKDIKNIFGNSDRAISVQDLSKLKYLEAVIKETLRLYPPVPEIAREIDKEFTLPSGFKLVPGVKILIHIWAMHRNCWYWGADADEFRPERFFDASLKHPAAFMPFSFGARNCVGSRYAMMSMMTLIVNLVRRYKILPSKNATKMKADEQLPLQIKYDIMLRHVDNFELAIENRRSM